jgi:hypothetical protein
MLEAAGEMESVDEEARQGVVGGWMDGSDINNAASDSDHLLLLEHERHMYTYTYYTYTHL